MAGTIKIELDIPEFQNTLGINIELVKDGSGMSGYYSTSTITTSDLPTLPNNPITNPSVTYNSTEGAEKKTSTTPTTSTTTTTKKGRSGNMMNIDF